MRGKDSNVSFTDAVLSLSFQKVFFSYYVVERKMAGSVVGRTRLVLPKLFDFTNFVIEKISRLTNDMRKEKCIVSTSLHAIT